MNRELFIKKLDCFVHQAKVRNIVLSSNFGWGLVLSRDKLALRNRHQASLLSPLLEGHKVPKTLLATLRRNLASDPAAFAWDLARIAASMFDTQASVIRSFQDGWARQPLWYTGADQAYAHALGKYYAPHNRAIP
jgi:hypothetical protein